MGMPNWLDVNPRSGIPIYVQLVQQIRHALDVGILRPGESLPTVRQLAAELTIAPNTIVKAYSELENLGLIESRPGVGTTVSADVNGRLPAQQREDILERLRSVIRDASQMNISDTELRTSVEEHIQAYYVRKPDA
jgi:GntR family transcriptional regulator